jgi:hypothetical protein
MAVIVAFPRLRARAIVSLASVAVSAAVACSQDANPSPGQLVVVLDTDVALPDQIDTIELIVSVPGTTLLDTPLMVGSGTDAQPIPATLTLVAGPDPTVPATIQVIGLKNGVARTLRQVVTTVPTDHSAMLRMPVQWLCDGTANPVADGDGGVAYQSTCGPGATCQAGSCVAASVQSSNLRTYQPELVFGGGAPPTATGQTTGTCFDTISCLLSGAVEVPDDQCTADMPADTANVNVGLRVAGDGICDTTGATCFVPLDGASVEGWTEQNGRIALPPAVCTKLRTGLIAGVVVSTSCPTKTDAVPPCGSWSSVAPAVDAGFVSMSDAAAVATPELIAVTTPDGGTSTACCPLLADSNRLYSCVCRGTSPVQVVSIDPTSGVTTEVGTFSPRATRVHYAAAMAGGDVWWIDRASIGDAATVGQVFGTPALDGGSAALLATVNGDIYDNADLLADSTSLYALADNVSGLGALAAPVQLIRVTRATGVVTPLDTGGALAMMQFTEDAEAVYVGVDTDAPLDAGIERISRIVRFPISGGPSTIVVQTTLTTSDASHGGFIGLQYDGAALIALFEAPPAADGTVDTQVLRLDPADAGSSLVYDETVDPTFGRLRLLGAVSGAVVLVRDTTANADAGNASSESVVLVVPPSGGAPRIAATFAQDTPVFELQTPTFSPDSFWINASGRVFRLPAGALQ